MDPARDGARRLAGRASAGGRVVAERRDAARDPEAEPIVLAMQQATADVGRPGSLGGLDSWYDGATFTHLAGIPSIGFGPPGFDADGVSVAHVIDEYVPVDGLVACAQALAVAAMRFCGGGSSRLVPSDEAKFVRTDEAVRGGRGYRPTHDRSARPDEGLRPEARRRRAHRSPSARASSPASSARTARASRPRCGSSSASTRRPPADVTVNGKRYREHTAPLHEVGALLEARSVHTGRSAYNHLLALAQTHGIAQAPRRRAGRPGRPARGRAQARRAVLARAWASGSASRRRCSATRRRCCSTSRSTGSTRKGSTGSATCSKSLAAEGRTVFVSSHLMTEMALTADHLIVIGRGRLIADTSVEEFVRRASGSVVRVRSPAGDAPARAAARGRRHRDQPGDRRARHRRA